MNNLVYMAVTNDELELPLAVEDKLMDMAKKLGISHNTIRHCLSLNRVNKTNNIKFLKVLIEEGEV